MFEYLNVLQAKDSWEMNNPEKLASAETSKEKGNTAFKEGRLDRAVRWYEKVRPQALAEHYCRWSEGRPDR